jgi:hypothetical protein
MRIKFEIKSILIISSLISPLFISTALNLSDVSISILYLIYIYIVIFLTHNNFYYNGIKGFLLYSTLSSSLGIYSFFYGNFDYLALNITYDESLRRISGLENVSTAFGISLGLGILLLITGKYIENKLLSVLFLIILLVGLILSGSRTPIFLLITIFILRLFLQKKRNILNFLFLLFLVLITIYLNIDYLKDNIYIIRRVLSSDTNLSFGGRYDKFDDVLILLDQSSWVNLLFGYGHGNFNEVLNRGIGAHSGFTRNAIEHGILMIFVALSIFVYVTVVFIKDFNFFKSNKNSNDFLYFYYIFLAEITTTSIFGLTIIGLMFILILPRLTINIRCMD